MAIRPLLHRFALSQTRRSPILFSPLLPYPYPSTTLLLLCRIASAASPLSAPPPHDRRRHHQPSACQQYRVRPLSPPETLAQKIGKAVRRPGAPSKARVYADVNVIRPKDYWDYESLAVQWGYPMLLPPELILALKD